MPFKNPCKISERNNYMERAGCQGTGSGKAMGEEGNLKCISWFITLIR